MIERRRTFTIKSRPLTGGGISWFIYARPPLPDGSTLIPVKQYKRAEDRAAVEAFAATVRAQYETLPKRETADDWYDRFIKTRMGRVTTAASDHQVWLKWISPVLGGKMIDSVSPDDVERVRDVLDRAVDEWEAAGKTRGVGLAYSSAGNVWAILTLAMKHALTRAGARDMRVAAREVSPCHNIRPPRTGASKRRHWLRPVEVTRFLACDAVPLEWRIAVALAVYLHLRPGELQELRAKDIDLEAGEVSITRAWAKKIKGPKSTAGTRTVTIPPHLMPLLEALTNDANGETLLAPVVGATSEHDRPELFRAQLRLAGVTRPELYADTATHEQIDFRSTRDTGITWRFLAGDRAEHVQREAGHEDLSTTLGYAKEVDNRHGRFGEPFPALPFACERRVNENSNSLQPFTNMVARVGFEGKKKSSKARGYPPARERFSPLVVGRSISGPDRSHDALHVALTSAVAGRRYELARKILDLLAEPAPSKLRRA